MNDPTQTLRVLMVTARADFGGGPEHVLRLIEALPATIVPYVACPRDVPYWQLLSETIGTESLIEIPHRRFRFANARELVQRVRDLGIDLIHSHGMGAWTYSCIVGRRSGRPRIHTFHGIHIEGRSGVRRSAYLRVARWLARCTAQLIAVSQGEADAAEAYGLARTPPHGGTPSRLPEITVIENGVPIPEQRSQGQAGEDGRRLVVSMTRFNPQKNSDLMLPILEALKSRGALDQVRFVMLGTGPDRANFERAIRERGFSESVDLAGAVPDPDSYLARAFCCLSTSRWEGMPLALVEAMARGVPPVATDVVGNRDVVQSGLSGLLYPLDRPHEAAEHLVDLVEHRSLWTRLSDAARDRAEARYDVRRMAEQTAALYRAVLESSSSAAGS